MHTENADSRVFFIIITHETDDRSMVALIFSFSIIFLYLFYLSDIQTESDPLSPMVEAGPTVFKAWFDDNTHQGMRLVC